MKSSRKTEFNNISLSSGTIVKYFLRETFSEKTLLDNPTLYLYRIDKIAKSPEDLEEIIVYQALFSYNEEMIYFDTFSLPLYEFLEEVDHEKYPNIKQKYKFEKFI